MGGEYTMANAVTSKTTALDRRARAGGEMDGGDVFANENCEVEKIAKLNGLVMVRCWSGVVR
jgi:hypothetical protein